MLWGDRGWFSISKKFYLEEVGLGLFLEKWLDSAEMERLFQKEGITCMSEDPEMTKWKRAWLRKMGKKSWLKCEIEVSWRGKASVLKITYFQWGIITLKGVKNDSYIFVYKLHIYIQQIIRYTVIYGVNIVCGWLEKKNLKRFLKGMTMKKRLKNTTVEGFWQNGEFYGALLKEVTCFTLVLVLVHFMERGYWGEVNLGN